MFDIMLKHLAASTVLARIAYTVGKPVVALGRAMTARTSKKFPVGYLLVAER
jgi:hypothetical protein